MKFNVTIDCDGVRMFMTEADSKEEAIETIRDLFNSETEDKCEDKHDFRLVNVRAVPDKECYEVSISKGARTYLIDANDMNEALEIAKQKYNDNINIEFLMRLRHIDLE